MSAAPFSVLLCRNLLFVSKVLSAAGASGHRVVSAQANSLPTHLADPACVQVLVDLSDNWGDLAQLRQTALAGRPAEHPSVRWIAFGPHVDVAALESAVAAGFDEAMPRSRFNSLLPQLFV